MHAALHIQAVPVTFKQHLSYLKTVLPSCNQKTAVIDAHLSLNSLYSRNKGRSDHNYGPH